MDIKSGFMVDWASLPHELLVLIVGLVKKFQDFASFGTVCKSWHAAATKELFKALWLRERTPYMMFPVRDENISDLYSLAEGEIVASVRFRNLSKRRYYESLGWLLAVDNDGSMCLFDPFSNTEISLPRFGRSHVFIKKMVLSARPSDDPNDPSDFVVALMVRSVMGVAFWKPGYKSWHLPQIKAVFEDITYHAGNYYVFDALYQVINFNILNGFPKEGQVFAPYINGALPSLGGLNNLNVYIVKMPRSLLLVSRSCSPGLPSERTSKFQVYEHVSSGTWNEINNLGNMALFLGCDSATTIVDASRFTGSVKANHIYFTDDCKRNHFGDICPQYSQDMGIYDLGNGRIDPFDHREAFNGKVSHLTWIFPFLWSSTADEMHTL